MIRWTSCGIARKPSAHPPSASAKTTWVRWSALSMFRPSQQLWNLNVRTTRLPAGHRGYLSLSCRSSKPVQLQDALALATPLVNDMASPVMIRRKRGISTTLPTGLPRNVSETEAGVWI